MAEEFKDQAGRTVIQSKNFRLLFANTFRLRIGDNDTAITFGAETDGPAGTLQVVDEVQVLITPRIIKLLHFLLGSTIAELEKVTGPIPLPQQILDSVKRTVVQQAKPKKKS